MIIALCGKTGAGKSRICEEMMSHGWIKIITYTTRPPRPGEVNHLDYEFVSEDEFMAMVNRAEFAESFTYVTKEGVWKYGSRMDDYMERGDFVIVLTPAGIKRVKQMLPDEDIRSVMIDSERFLRKLRLRKRGDDPLEVGRRMKADDNDFADFKADYYFHNALFTNPKKLAEKIIREVTNDKRETDSVRTV